MSTTFTYSVRRGDKVVNHMAKMAGSTREYAEADLIKHIEFTDLHRGPDEIFDIQVLAHDDRPILPPESPTLSADITGMALKDSRSLIRSRRTPTVYTLADGSDKTPHASGATPQSVSFPENAPTPVPVPQL